MTRELQPPADACRHAVPVAAARLVLVPTGIRPLWNAEICARAVGLREPENGEHHEPREERPARPTHNR
jgi:hypothetical protein